MKILYILIFVLIIIMINSRPNVELFDSTYYIKNLEPKIIHNENAKIAFVYLFTDNIYDYCKHSIKNILAYCNVYDYAFIVYDEVFNDDVSPCWNKIPAIMNNLQKYDYLVWIDADAIINNFNISIESIIDLSPGKDLYLCEDVVMETECINSGIMIIKNTEWTIDIFNKTWNSSFYHEHNDQNVLFNVIVQDVYPDSESSLKYNEYCHKNIHPKVFICPENTFNCYIKNLLKDDFIIHLMGASKETRINVMRQVNTKIGLDNYDVTNCVDILDNYNESDRVTQIINNCII